MNRLLQIFRIPDLRKKVFIVGGILVAFRLLAAIPIPGIDAAKLQEYFSSNQLFGFLNFFSGGGLSNLSILMLGVGPYITATIIMQLLTIIFPKFKEMYYEQGSQGQAKFNQWSRLLTLPLALVQSYSFLSLLIARGVLDRPAPLVLITNIIVISAGSMIALWLGELITEQKIGNGISLIILAGIISSLPSSVGAAIVSYSSDQLIKYIIFAAVALAIIAAVTFLNEGERRITIAYARRVRGNKIFGGSSSYLPLKVNQAGMIPLIFAISVLLFPQFLAQIITLFSARYGLIVTDYVTRFLNNHLAYGLFYFTLVVVFTYFYTAITFNPEEISKNLQRNGGFIPGIRPGVATEKYFSQTVQKITLFGAVFLGFIAVLPSIVQYATGISVITISGTAILIVVAVALEIMRQIDSQLTVREYDGIE